MNTHTHTIHINKFQETTDKEYFFYNVKQKTFKGTLCSETGNENYSFQNECYYIQEIIE